MNETVTLLRALECGRQGCTCHRSATKGYGLVHCPYHDPNKTDRTPSLSVSEKDGKTLWHCHQGCDRRVVTEAVMAFLPKPEGASPAKVVRETTFDYGTAKHRRLDYDDGTKRMWWEPRGVSMADLPLWNGDLLRESRFDNEPVLLVEGEKDANRGVMFGFCAVSLAGGASQRDFGAALDDLRDREVVLVPDQDDPGRHLMQAVAAKLIEVGSWPIKILVLPPASHDLSDFLDGAADDDPVGARIAMKAMVESALVLWP